MPSRAPHPALRNAWRVNLLDLSFRSVTAVTLAAMLGLCLFVVAVLPRSSRRTRQTDAIEYALVILLTVMFSPLSFNYAYVWLIYPMTLGLHLVMSEPSGARGHRLKVAWITAVFLIPALAIPMPLLAQAYGNLFVPALLLLLRPGGDVAQGGQRSSRSSRGRFGRLTAWRSSFKSDRDRAGWPFVRIEIAGACQDAEARSEPLAPRFGGGGREDLMRNRTTSAFRPTLALPFFGLWPRMPPPFKRGIQREGMRRMDRKRIAVAV